MEQRTITSMEGADNFPQNDNDVLELIETIARQNIKGLKSANKLVDGIARFDVSDGKVLEEAVIKMAEARVFDKNDYSRAPLDPTIAVKYFNNYEAKQYKVTIRRNDIRKIIANKGVGVEDVVSEILDTLTQGEGHDDYVKSVNLLYNANFVDFKTSLGGVPASMKGVIYALRDMYNKLKHDNKEFTSEHEYISATREGDIRIAMSTELANLLDVSELANVLNLSKEELFGKVVIFDASFEADKNPFIAFVYDVNALGCATRLYELETERVASGLYDNAYLTIDRCFYHCGLFKGVKLNCAEACATAKAQLVGSATSQSITKALTQVTTTSTIASVDKYTPYEADFVVGEGYNLLDDTAVATLTMGGSDIAEGHLIVAEDGMSAHVYIPQVTGNVVVTLTAIADE